MYPRQGIPPALTRLAELQAGVVSIEQILGTGLSREASRRLVREGWWNRMSSGLYLTSPSEADWNALAWAGVLAGGDGARLGGEPSAFLHGVVEAEPMPIEVLVAPERRARVSGPWTFRREQPGSRSPRTVGNPPRLTVEAAVVDAAAGRTEPEVVSLVTTAVQRRRTRPERLLAELEARARHPHRRLLTGLLAEVDDGAESPLELSFVRDVERAHGLPRGARQRSRFGLSYCSDVAYEAYQLLVELDGQDGHVGTGRFRDLERDNQFALRGWLTLRYGWFDVTDHPCRVAGQVAAHLRDRGWRGDLRRCRRCVLVPEAELWSA